MLFCKINSEDLYKKLGDNEKTNCIFNHLDSLDNKQDGEINSSKAFEPDKKFIQSLIGEVHTGEDIGGMVGDLKYVIDDEKLEKYIKSHEDLKAITKEDFKKALNTIIEINEQKEHEEYEKQQADRIAAHSDLPKEIATLVDVNQKVKATQQNGKTYFEVTDDKGLYKKINENGYVVAYKSEILSTSENPDKYNTLGEAEQMELFSEENEGENIGDILRYKKNGVVDYNDFVNNQSKRKMGKTEFNYKEDRLENISINNGLPNQTKLECEYDENGSIKDFKMTQKREFIIANTDGLAMDIDSPIKMDTKTKETLTNLMNGGAKFGEDFAINMENNEIKIDPIIQNDTTETMPPVPKSVQNEVLNLAQKGFRNNRDYTVKYNEDGSFEINFETAKGRNFENEDKKIFYSKDGKTKITQSLSGDEIKTVIEDNSSKSINTQNRRDAFLEKLLASDFKAADKALGDIRYQGSDFEFFSLCKQYQEITGKELMSEIFKAYDKQNIGKNFIQKLVPNGGVTLIGNLTKEKKDAIYKESVMQQFNENLVMYNQINSFDIKKSEIGDLIFKKQKEEISDNQYVQNSNETQYKLTKNENSITVEKDGKNYNLDLKGLNENVKNMIFKSDANTLYRLASQKTKLELYSNRGATGYINDDINGQLYSYENKITLNEETMSLNIMRRTLAHETGHTFYVTTTPKNEELETSFTEELEKFENSDEPFKEGDHSYCAANVYEMVAESYTLLTEGHSKSEYTIAKHFPKTFAIAKKMIEEKLK